MALLIQFFKLIPAVILVLTATIVPIGYSIHAAYAVAAPSSAGPTINDPNLKVEVVFKDLKKPTSMTFLGPNDILVLEKDIGTVQRIINGKMLAEPLLDVNVANANERGLLGIAVAKHTNGPTYVFLYYTEAKVDGEDDCPKVSYCVLGHDPLGNRLYRYELVDNKLVNPKLLLDLPAVPFPTHNGGEIIIGPDNNVYFTIGDVGNKGNAYGIRNSFGIDFDPVTKKLWDSENGPSFGDEINLVEPGFNSGWNKVQGVWAVGKDQKPGNVIRYPHNLVTFGGRGKYSPPDFTWNSTPGLTALKFLSSDKLGKQYQNDMFVGDFHRGNLYHFELNEERTGLSLKGPLLD